MKYLKTKFQSRPIGVDREANVLRGYVVAQAGPFKDRRGEFNQDGLSDIASMINREAKGLKSRFTHPGLSSDGLGSYLGRAKNATLDGGKVRADLHFADVAFHNQKGHDLASYVMSLAEEDPEAISSSLVISPREEFRLNDKGKPLVGDDGEPLPPLWFPERLHATDIVEEGAAVDALLSAGIDADELPDAVVWHAYELLNRQFPRLSRQDLRAKVVSFLDRYLDERYGVKAVPQPDGWKIKARMREIGIDGHTANEIN